MVQIVPVDTPMDRDLPSISCQNWPLNKYIFYNIYILISGLGPSFARMAGPSRTIWPKIKEIQQRQGFAIVQPLDHAERIWTISSVTLRYLTYSCVRNVSSRRW